jgi:hypothetical protein
MPEVPASDATIVAVVDRVYEAPEVLQFLAGKSITVLTQDAGTLHAGQDVLFLARAGSTERVSQSSRSVESHTTWITTICRNI